MQVSLSGSRRHALVCNENTSVLDAARLMRKHHVHSLPVVLNERSESPSAFDEDECEVVGVVDISDIVFHALEVGLDGEQTAVTKKLSKQQQVKVLFSTPVSSIRGSSRHSNAVVTQDMDTTLDAVIDFFTLDVYRWYVYMFLPLVLHLAALLLSTPCYLGCVPLVFLTCFAVPSRLFLLSPIMDFQGRLRSVISQIDIIHLLHRHANRPEIAFIKDFTCGSFVPENKELASVPHVSYLWLPCLSVSGSIAMVCLFLCFNKSLSHYIFLPFSHHFLYFAYNAFFFLDKTGH